MRAIFLLPGGKALRATAANKARFEDQRAQLETRNLESKGEAAGVAERLNGQNVHHHSTGRRNRPSLWLRVAARHRRRGHRRRL